MLKMIKVRRYDFELLGKDESECRRECLKICQCHAYAGIGKIQRVRDSIPTKCWIWSEDLGSLQEDNTNGYNLYTLSLGVAKSDNTKQVLIVGMIRILTTRPEKFNLGIYGGRRYLVHGKKVNLNRFDRLKIYYVFKFGL